jgi:hypothetical protein
MVFKPSAILKQRINNGAGTKDESAVASAAAG